MSQPAAAEFVGSLLTFAVGGVIFLLWLGFVLTVSSNLRQVREQAERQTALLEQIARHTRPPEPPGAPPLDRSLDHLFKAPKTFAAPLLVVLSGLALLVLALALTR